MGGVQYDDRRRLASPAASNLQLPGEKHEVVELLAVVAAGSAVGGFGEVIDLAGSLVERFEHLQVEVDADDGDKAEGIGYVSPDSPLAS